MFKVLDKVFGLVEEDVDKDGCVPVPDGPGLGVTYDWGHIRRLRTRLHVFE